MADLACRAAWNRPSRRVLVSVAIITVATLVLWWSSLYHIDRFLPSVSVESPYPKQARRYNQSKLALLVESRPVPVLAPLMLHFISVVPPDWPFRFMGSVESVRHIEQSAAIRAHVAAGKLDLTYIPANMTTGSTEEISRFLTNRWLYEVVLQPAEWLLVFQTDSMLCANSRRNLNDYLEYDWIGAPWGVDTEFGGNGGLSLRRVSAILDVLRHQEREFGTEPEDVWLTTRLGHRPGAKMANSTVSLTFSGENFVGNQEHVEPPEAPLDSPDGLNRTLEAASKGTLIQGIDDWRDGFYEPMGYHLGDGSNWLSPGIWGNPRNRKHIWDYCPEIKMVLHMDAAKFVPGECNAHWRRAVPGTEPPWDEQDTELIDGVVYPRLPAGLMSW